MDKRWFEQYPEGVPHDIDTNQYASIVELFKESCHHNFKNTAYSNLGIDLSYAQLDKLSRNLGAYLQSLGLEKGARVAIMMPNILQYPVALFAILRAGFVVVNTNPLYTADEVTYQLNDSGAQAILVMANFAHVVEKALPALPFLKHVIITELADLFPFPKRILINSVIKYIKKMIPPYSIPHAVAFNYATQEGKQSVLHRIELHHEDIAFLQYTGGTTGVSKGAMLTHGNIIANLLQLLAWTKPINMSHHDIVLTALPLYHIFSLTNCLLFMTFGAKNLLITNPRDIPHFIDQIKKARFTFFPAVNTLYNALLNHPKFKEIDFSQLKLSLAGGMALQQVVSDRWIEETNTPLIEAYGLTETSPGATANPYDIGGYNGSIGLPLPSTDVVIRDDEGVDVPIGSSGELCIKGPQVMLGYWKRPDETSLAFTSDGFFKTGDIARMDEEGFIYLVDRKKDMILVSGFNVYPNEIEQVIAKHPGVVEVGVIGVPDDESGERVKACVVKRDPDLTEKDIIAYCRDHLTGYKLPKTVQFYKELPKTNVGKILRRMLRD